jgi:threonine/homoserine/homoserine lactone efflux protein
MRTFLALAALIFVGAITPGPNNLAVLNAAAHRGVAGAGSAILGVLLGSLALLVLALSGLGALFAAQPRLRDAVRLAGCGYLCWLGAGMIAGGLSRRPRPTDVVAPPSTAHLFGLQFTNPKAWTMVLTAVAAARATMSSASAALVLVMLFAAVPAVCLSAWAWLGAWAIRRMQGRTTRAWFDCLMGVLLVGSAIALMTEVTLWNSP